MCYRCTPSQHHLNHHTTAMQSNNSQSRPIQANESQRTPTMAIIHTDKITTTRPEPEGHGRPMTSNQQQQLLRSLFFSLSLDLIFLILSDDLIRCTFPDLIRSFYPDLIAQPSTCVYLAPYMHSPHAHCTVTYMRLPCVVHALTMC